MMRVSTTQRVTFLEKNTPSLELHECESPLFSEIRRCVRALHAAIYLPEADVRQNESAVMLRMDMMKWLTSPLLPDIDILSRCSLADENRTRRNWGEDAANKVSALKKLICSYREDGSVLNAEFVRVYTDLICEHGSDQVKIWCHRNECDLFRDLLQGLTDLDDQTFICSLAEYRNVPSIHALLKVGPLRAHGFAKTPEALIMSPIYRKLVRFIWRGLTDEDGFASDPVFPSRNYLSEMRPVRHTVFSNQHSVSFGQEPDPVNDFLFFKEAIAVSTESQRCVLVELPGDHGILLRPRSNHLVFSPQRNDADAISYRLANEMEEGDFLLIHDADADLGEINVDAGKAPLAALWKTALAEMYRRHPSLCVQKMKDAGIALQDLHRAVQNWTSMSGSVIHAPQSRKHFQALLTRVLDPGLIASRKINGEMTPGWRLAWSEMKDSRVSAIQHGVIETVIVSEQLESELGKDIAHLRDMCSSTAIYSHQLPQESGLVGNVEFYPIVSISSGFAAPPEEFGKPMPLLAAEQYRGEPEEDL